MRVMLRFTFVAAAAVLLFAVSVTSNEQPQVSPAFSDLLPTVTVSSGAACTPVLMWKADGDSAGDQLGSGLAGGGDLDGDSKPDIASGSMSGDRLGDDWMGFFRAWYDNFESSFERYGDTRYTGDEVAFAGDVNGDGKDELLVGAANADVGPYTKSGLALIYDNVGAIIETIGPFGNNDRLGYDVGGVGDWDGDGFDDVIVSAPFATTSLGMSTGYVLIYSPRLNAVLRRFEGSESGEGLGTSVARAGFVDADSNEDVIIGAESAFVEGEVGIFAGSAFVYSHDGTLLWRFDGEHEQDRFGQAVSGAGDVNNDGHDDLIVGANMADPSGFEYAGSAYVYSGADGSLLWQFDGTDVNQFLGKSVAGVGDVDSDGFDDIAVGAPGTAPGGSVFVYSGQTGQVIWQFDGVTAGGWLGHSVEAAGDVNGDGRPDILMSASHTDPSGRTDAGTVYLYGCPSEALPPTIQSSASLPCELGLVWQADGDSIGEYFGFSVDGDGDWDADGTHDIVVGSLLAYEEVGASGSTSLFMEGLTQVWKCLWNLNADFGRSVCFMGDLDGLGGEELVVGAPGHGAPGSDSCGIVIVTGTHTFIKFSWVGEATGDKLGYCVANVGDVNGDGYDDIIAGAPEATGPLGGLRQGYALLLSPKTNSLITRFDDGGPGDYFGRAVAGAGDINDDHVNDVIIGAPQKSPPGAFPVRVGAAIVYSSTGEFICRFNGENINDFFGNSVASAGDVNNDGVNDLIVGAWLANPGGVADAGSAYIYSGATRSLIRRLDGEGPGHCFGYSVRGLGDVNGDSHDDVIIGAHRADLGGHAEAGAAYVYSGADGALLWKIEGGMANDLLGVSVARAADFTLDGRPDFVVGAFKTDPDSRINAGSAYLFGCACDCAYNGDPVHDGVTDVLDVVGTVSDAFRGDPNDKSSSCRYCDSDADCSGACDIIDVVKMVNVAFRGADKATEFCNGCQ